MLRLLSESVKTSAEAKGEANLKYILMMKTMKAGHEGVPGWSQRIFRRTSPL